jgi:predicted ATPase/DNA-binding winged helix-turn-helix (wHTH) protein
MTQGNALEPAALLFGPFRLLCDQRLLLDGETPVRLGGRAYEILAMLVERPGLVVTKEELFARVWPKQIVEEGNLKFNVAALRKALRDGQGGVRYISNIPGRGYCFVAPVETLETDASAILASNPTTRPRQLPASLRRIVGRSDVIVSLATQLPEHRFITIVGPGGIGKTTVAVAVADALATTFKDGVGFVDLAALSDPSLVTSTIAGTLGFAVPTGNAVNGLVSIVGNRDVLIVLDNCEHLIEPIAALAEEIFRGAPKAHILATSREPLRADGERVHRLAPLATPLPSQDLTAAQALAFPAVQLFVERAAASQDSFELSDTDAPVVAELCRGLDGIALAIEIAAGRVDTFGITELASGLDSQFRLLMRGRRTSLGRHQTLAATLDWSYQLLSETERAALRGLGIFAGVFTFHSTCAVLQRDDLSASVVLNAITNLVAKSLVSVSIEKGISFYRLFETTRAYALIKLEESGEKDRLAARHAGYYLALLRQAEAEWHRRPAAEWLEANWRVIDNVRAALDWGFSPTGDPVVGVALTEAAVPLWFQLSMMSECCDRVEHALSRLPVGSDPRREMHLQASLAWSLMQTRGSDSAAPAWNEVLRLAERLGDVDYQLRSLWGLWSARLNSGRLREALALAERFCALADQSDDTNDPFVGDRMVGYISHLLGEQGSARLRIERMLAHYVTPRTGPRIVRFIFDQRATARSFLARVLWLQGFPDQAAAAAQMAVDEAKAARDMLTVCQALVQAACPISILVGDYRALESFVETLLDYSSRNALAFWRVWGRCFRGVLLIKTGRLDDGLMELRQGMEELRSFQYGVYYIVFLCEYAAASGQVRNLDEGLRAIDEALARSGRNEEHWYAPELLRVKGELTLQRAGQTAAAEAEELFRQSLEWARRQETPSWELRTAISLVRLHQADRRTSQETLQSVYGKFAEGHASADLVVARELLGETTQSRQRSFRSQDTMPALSRPGRRK